MKSKKCLWINAVSALVAACTLVHANAGTVRPQEASALTRVRGNESPLTPRLGPESIVTYPSTLTDVLSNLLYIIEHDVTLRTDFYQSTTLQQLLGARDFLKTAPTPGEEVQCFSLRAAPNQEKTHGFAGSSVLIRKGHVNGGNAAIASLTLQILDPIVRRPTYHDVAVLVERRWKPTVVVHRTMPIGKNVAPPHSNVLHGNADMTLAIRTLKARSTLEFIFDSSGKLHTLIVITQQTIGRE